LKVQAIRVPFDEAVSDSGNGNESISSIENDGWACRIGMFKINQNIPE
jgi:hypothetical protein